MMSGPEEAAASWLRAKFAVSSVYPAPTLSHRQLSCVMHFDDPERGLKVVTVISADVGDEGARAAILLRLLLKKRSKDPIRDYFSGVSNIYEFEYASNANSDDLVIVLSAYHKIQKTVNNANKNVLYIADTSATYFFRHIYRVVAAIDKFVAESHFKRVLFFGGSKAGFSAILLAAQFARSAPQQVVHCLAFSPHTRLFPYNKSLNLFASYVGFQARAKQHPPLAALMRKFGNLRPAVALPNLFMTIVFCERHRVDAAEAAYMTHPRVNLVPLPFQFHTSVLPFLISGQKPAHREKMCKILFEKLELLAPDVRGEMPTDLAAFCREMDAADWIPPIHEMVERSLSWRGEPAALRAAAE
jgi:hypothetical protein